MRTVLAFLCIFLLANLYAEDIRPDSSNTPLFQIFAVTQQHDIRDPANPGERPLHHATIGNQPLLTVYSLHDFFLQPDKKSVRILLNDEDTKTFARLSRENSQLFFITPEKKGADVLIHHPIDDGSLMFEESHYTGVVAEYLRRRFHIKPGSNDKESSSAVMTLQGAK